MTFITRFAPSPTGPLHLGHAFSALTAARLAEAEGGRFLLRIDDLDQTRARPEFEDRLKADLAWLGLTWPEPCRRQSDCLNDYAAALDRLWQAGLLYPCNCTRRDIAQALDAPQEGVRQHGPDGLIYPGTCRPLTPPGPTTPRPEGVTLRLDMARATARAGIFATGAAQFMEGGESPDGRRGRIAFTGAEMIREIGDVVLARRDMPASYHLAVAVDDAAQQITCVVRGRDLFEATRIHVLLQSLLGLPTPRYHHHRLIRDQSGKRLAKRDDARAISRYREDGLTPEELIAITRA